MKQQEVMTLQYKIVPISTIVVYKVVRADPAQVLRYRDMLERGEQFRPIIIDTGDHLLDGRCRLEAIQLLGCESVAVNVATFADTANQMASKPTGNGSANTSKRKNKCILSSSLRRKRSESSSRKPGDS